MRISDWSSDVCSSDLLGQQQVLAHGGSGYFPARLVRPHLESGRLTHLQDAPVFSLPAYAVYPADLDPALLATARRPAGGGSSPAGGVADPAFWILPRPPPPRPYNRAANQQRRQSSRPDQRDRKRTRLN